MEDHLAEERLLSDKVIEGRMSGSAPPTLAKDSIDLVVSNEAVICINFSKN